jgi:hypothetical protein
MVGMGIYYNALRVVDGRVQVVRCRGDEDRPEDRQEARDEERVVERYIEQLRREKEKRLTANKAILTRMDDCIKRMKVIINSTKTRR